MTKEKYIENDILVYLNSLQDTLAFKVSTGGFFDTRKRVFRKNTSQFVIPGTPDIFCVHTIDEFPIAIFFEVKSEKGRQSDNQKNFQKLVENVGGFYFLVRSVDDAVAGIHTVDKWFMKLIPSPPNLH